MCFTIDMHVSVAMQDMLNSLDCYISFKSPKYVHRACQWPKLVSLSKRRFERKTQRLKSLISAAPFNENKSNFMTVVARDRK